MPFVKNDPRINRSGRPAGVGIAAIRKKLVEIGSETIRYNGQTIKKAEAILRNIVDCAIEGDEKKQRLYCEYLYGKPRQELDVSATIEDKTVDEYTPEIMEFVQRFLGGEQGDPETETETN